MFEAIQSGGGLQDNPVEGFSLCLVSAASHIMLVSCNQISIHTVPCALKCYTICTIKKSLTTLDG